MDLNQSLEEVEERLRPIYRKHWHTIRKSIKRGLIKDMYHYPLLYGTDEEIIEKLNDVLQHYSRSIKINVAFGFVLRKGIEYDGELRFFHPSNNTMLFDLPRLIATDTDKKNLLNDIEQTDGFNYARAHRPSTKWVVDGLICVRFDVFKLQ